ncbi:MAG: hypothetical protein KKA19_05625 [Candidatus Margulisbacteria bacterium]|nr:hypothetical protein [Candidatus Margulisiibacteriota bacterium]
MDVVVGLIGGQIVDKVTLMLLNGDKVFFEQTAEGVWKGEYYWPKNTNAGIQQSKFYFYRFGQEPVVKDYNFVIQGLGTLPSGKGGVSIATGGDLKTPAMLAEIAGISVLNKLRAYYVDNKTYVYAAVGFTEGAEKAKKVTVILDGGKVINLKETNAGLWQGEIYLAKTTKTIYQAKIYIKDVTGRTMYQTKTFILGKDTGQHKKLKLTLENTAAAEASIADEKQENKIEKVLDKKTPVKQSTVEAVKATSVVRVPVVVPQPTSLAKQEAKKDLLKTEKIDATKKLEEKKVEEAQKPQQKVIQKTNINKKINYQPKITLGPAALKGGSIIYIKVALNTAENIEKITATFDDGNTPLKKVGEEWQEQYRLGKNEKGLKKMKLFIKDNAGEVWAFEKWYQVN